MRIIFAGTPEAAVPALQNLAANHEILAVITRPDAPLKRGKMLYPSPVAEVAAELDLPIIKTKSLRDPQIQEQLIALQPELAVVVAYGAFVPQDLLDAFEWINLHFSILPKYRGAAPIQRAIQAGERHSGMTVFSLRSGMDNGPMYSYVELPLAPEASATQTLAFYAEVGAKHLGDVVQMLSEQMLETREQDEAGATFAPALTPAEGRINFNDTAAQVINHVRAFTDNPGAWTTLGVKRIKIGLVEQVDPEQQLDQNAAAGSILARKNQVLVKCADAWVELTTVAPAGKNWMEAAAWGRGLQMDNPQFGGVEA